ncbi:MAG: hypothetical protein K5866_10280 [Treponema sp.]|nr:hypothetical protein [Treponema sp.]
MKEKGIYGFCLTLLNFLLREGKGTGQGLPLQKTIKDRQRELRPLRMSLSFSSAPPNFQLLTEVFNKMKEKGIYGFCLTLLNFLGREEKGMGQRLPRKNPVK